MKITRLKRGYVIRLSDGEFEALVHIVELGKQDMVDGDQDVHLSPSGKKAARGRFSLIAAMEIDEDRR